jgi:hypothetical protein
VFINRFFDFNNYTVDIQEYIDDSLYFNLDPNFYKGANLYVVTNKAEIADSLLGIDTITEEFFSASDFREFDDAIDNNIAASIFIRQDKTFCTYSRR